MEKGGLFAWWCRVQERGALRRHRDRPNTNGLGFRPAATSVGLEVGWRKLGEGRNSVVASIVFLFPEGKRERGEDKGMEQVGEFGRKMMLCSRR